MIKGGPKIINDGLVLCLDAHDAKSYAGEPVTNLASSSFYTWVNSGAWTSNTYTTHESSPVGFPPGLKGVSGVQVLEGICTTAGSIHFGTGHVNPVSASTQYTYSVWFYQKGRAGIGAPYARANVSNSNLGTMKYNGTTGSSNWPVNKWIKLEITFTTQGSDTQTYISNYIGSQVGDTMYFCAPQSEQKSYYSPYANGSRSATNGWVDRSGNSNSGTLVNMVGTGVSHYRDGQVIMPVANSYLEFDGSNDYISIADDTTLDITGDITISCWVSLNSSQNGLLCILVNKRDTSDYTSPYYMFFEDRGGENKFGVLLGGGSPNYVIAGSNNNFDGVYGKWDHVCFTVSGTTVSLYVNGVFDASGTFTGTRQTNNVPLRLGGSYTNGFLNYMMSGKMANVLIYNKALTAAEVLSNYNATKGRFS